jgi:hypothetical protein
LVDDFTENYLKALTYGKELFVLGDLNCNMLKVTSQSKALKDLYQSCLNLSLTNKSNRKIIIANRCYYMTSNSSLVVGSRILETHVSDHYLVFSVLNLKMPKPAPIYITARNYKNYDRHSFLEDLTQINWTENILDDYNEKVDHFNLCF